MGSPLPELLQSSYTSFRALEEVLPELSQRSPRSLLDLFQISPRAFPQLSQSSPSALPELFQSSFIIPPELSRLAGWLLASWPGWLVG